jgi:hypothetical protein
MAATTEDLRALHAIIANLELVVQAQQAEVLYLKNKFTEKEEKEKKEEKPHNEKTHRDLFTNKKGFSNLPSYNGKAETYDDWHFKVTTYLEVEDEFKNLLEYIEKLTKEPTEESLGEWEFEGENRNAKTMNDQLYYFLCLNLKEEALTMVKNMKLKSLTCGVASWWKFHNECKALNGQRIQALANAVLTPSRVKKYADVTMAMDKWERDVNKYVLTTAQNIAEETKMFSLRQLVPDELDKLITANSNTLKNYEQVKAYVNEQVSLRKDKLNGPVPMEVNHLAEKILKFTEGTEEVPSWQWNEDVAGDEQASSCNAINHLVNEGAQSGNEAPEERGLAGTLETILSS